MAIDLTGITNENEFYTHHYLSAILENDLTAISVKPRDGNDQQVTEEFVEIERW